MDADRREGPGPADEARTYIVSPAVDLFFVGGASILFFALVRACHSGERTAEVMRTAYLLSWVVNWPHFSATCHRLYGSRETTAQFPVTSFLVPVLIAAVVVAALREPAVFAPGLMKLYLIWSPYHFSGQTLGLTLLYARRAGLRIEGWERRILTGFVYGSFLGGNVGLEVGSQTFTNYGVQYSSFGIPAWLGAGIVYASWAFALAFLAMAWRRWSQRRGTFPLVLLVVPVAQFLWLVPGAGTRSFYEFVPFFHSLQYLFVAWALNLRLALDADGVAPSRRFALGESLRWGLLNFVGGALLFWGLPRLAHHLTGVEVLLAEAIVVMGVQYHHFLVDGVIWRLRSPRVAGPLMVRFEDLVGALPPTGPAARPTGT